MPLLGNLAAQSAPSSGVPLRHRQAGVSYQNFHAGPARGGYGVVAGARQETRRRLVLCLGARSSDWSAMTVAELKEELRALSLPVTGRKSELIERLENASPASANTTEQATAADSASLADSAVFPDGGPMPPFDSVSLAQIQDELRRRGAPFSGKNKQEVYDRLEALLSEQLHARRNLTEEEMADWMLDRGLVPQGSKEAMAAMVDAGRAAEASSDYESDSGIGRDVLMDPNFDPDSLTMSQLKNVLRSFNLETGGRKNDLVDRVRMAIDSGNLAAADYDGPRTPRSATDNDPIEAVRQYLSELTVEECQDELRKRGLPESGSPVQIVGRLETVLLYEMTAQSEASRVDDKALIEYIEGLSLSELKQELRSRTEQLVGGTRSELEEELLSILRLEASGVPVSQQDQAAFWDVEDGEAAEEPQARGAAYSLGSLSHLLLTEPLERRRVAVIAGGPSAEAAVSINSARTIMDMLQTRPYPEQEEQLKTFLSQYATEDTPVESLMPQGGISIHAYYVDSRRQGWKLSPAQLYSNTPSDFEFKLPAIAQRFDSLADMAADIRATCDVAFPATHGQFGEDGELQAVLEAAGVHFVGSSAEACRTAFNKRSAHDALCKAGFPVLMQEHFTAADMDGPRLKEETQARLDSWAAEAEMDGGESVFVVKPADGGSSIGVTVCRGLDEVVAAAHGLFERGVTQQVVVEPKVLGAIEFTCTVIETRYGAVALPPSVIEIVDYGSDIVDAARDLAVEQYQQATGEYFEVSTVADDEDAGSVFSYSRKYMPSNQVRTHTPPMMPAAIVQAIRRSAERAFLELGLRDCARIDGWLAFDTYEMASQLIARYVSSQAEPQRLDPGEEDAVRGEPPLEQERPFVLQGNIPEEEVEAMGPQWNDELAEAEDVVFSPEHDRYFLASDLEALLEKEAADAAAAEPLPEDAVEPPRDAYKVAAGAPGAEIALWPTPNAVLEHDPAVLGTFSYGQVIFTEVNPVCGMEQTSFLFKQAAAVGLTHTAILRHLVSNALERAELPALPAPGPATMTTTPLPSAADVPAPAPAKDAEPSSGDDNSVMRDLVDPAPPPPAPTADVPRQRVFILCGGDSSERQVSLSSGVATWLQLSRYPDLDARLFLIAPQYAGLRERSRRAELLQKRNDLLLLGVPEDELPDALQLDAIRRPPLEYVPLEQRMVWAVPHALALRRSCEEVVEACECMLSMNSTVATAKTQDARDAAELMTQMQWELAGSAVGGVGDAFTGLGKADVSTMDFEAFAYLAQVSGAVVFNSIHGDVGEDGTLQSYLSHFNIPFTGSGEDASRVCMDKAATAECLAPLADSGVFTIPKVPLTLENMVDLCLAPAACDDVLEQLREHLGVEAGTSLCIKPAADGCSTGVMRIDTAEHLHTYAKAVAQEWDAIPAHLLSDTQGLVEMPPSASSTYLLEPFIQSDVLTVRQGDGGASALEREPVSGFVEVTVGVFGMQGEMHAMAPSVTLKSGDVLTLGEKFETGGGINLTPPPPDLVSADTVQTVQARAELIANTLNLHGMARIDAFMNVDDGTLYVIEVNTVPGLTPATVLFHQALAEQPPIYPNEFLRTQVLIALSGSASDDEQDDATFEEPFLGDYFEGGNDSTFLSDDMGWIEDPNALQT